MNWLSKAIKKAKKIKPGRFLERRVKQAFTRPSAWRKWKPGRDRGLGLGKFVTGLAQVATPTDDPMYDKLEYMSRGDSLASMGKRFATDDYKPLHEWETFEEEQDIKDFSDYSNQDIFNVFKSGDNTEIRKLLSSMGYEDIGGEFSEFIGNKMFDIEKAYKTAYAGKTAPIGKAWEKAGKGLAAQKRQGSSFGTGDDDSDVIDFFTDLETKYGDVDKEVLSGVVNEALAMLEARGDE